MFKSILQEAEAMLGIDLDDDGVIGEGGQQQQQQDQQYQQQDWSSAYTSNVNEDEIDEEHAAEQQGFFTANNAKTKALFVGINYINSSAELRGCINDVKTMRTLLRGKGFPLDSSNQRVLVEEENFPGYSGQPTKGNILECLDWLVEGAAPGDTLFLHYSGHGTSVADQDGDEKDGKDEALVPVDYQSAGLIRDDDLYEITVKRLPAGVRLTAILDCCHSGTLLDLPYNFSADPMRLQTTNRLRRRPHNPYRQQKYGSYESERGDSLEQWPDVLMFSGCKDDQTSADVSSTGSFENATASPGTAGGACSNSLAETLFLNKKGLTFVQLLEKMRANLKRRGFTQIPQLSSTKPVDLYAPFNFYGPFSESQQYYEE